MVETGEVKEAAKGIESGGHRLFIASEHVIFKAAEGERRASAELAGHLGDAFMLGSAVSAGLNVWDYTHERDNLRKQYEKEIAAKTGKTYHELSNKDLDAVGKQNAVIGEALKRARRKRNLAIVAGIAAVAVATYVVFPLAMTAVSGILGSGVPEAAAVAFSNLSSAAGLKTAGLFITKAVAVGLANVAAYMGTEKVVSSIAEPYLGLKEPSLHKVTKDPSLQDKLSVSSQVNYIEHLQKRVRSDRPESFISQEQVLKVFLAANPSTAKNIKARYGAEFGKLAPEHKLDIISSVGSQINLEQLTSDLNHGVVRAQELAFLVQGDASGVPPHDMPRVNALEKSHSALENRLHQAEAELHHLKQAFKAKTTHMGATSPQLASSQNAAPQQRTPGKFEQREIARNATRQGAAIGA